MLESFGAVSFPLLFLLRHFGAVKDYPGRSPGAYPYYFGSLWRLFQLTEKLSTVSNLADYR